ncbi:hypothetical protein HK105_200745 [Polyrhizophydium stewartii]|uniref:Vacuolar ATPase assembly protein VMA22 n=1 Tax=Polyrhizophydium stewartii TaxID=2732419 RepID=A0ABR4NJX6_9FUNG
MQHQDERLLRILDLLDDVSARSRRISGSMGAGFFGLAQAKYIIGPGRLTQLQFDQRMQAVATIEHAGDDGDDGMRLVRSDVANPAAAAKPAVPKAADAEPAESAAPAAEPVPGGAGLRRRRDRGSGEGDAEPSSELVPDVTEPLVDSQPSPSPSPPQSPSVLPSQPTAPPAPQKPAHNDPINWFGVLVPSQLRNSQRSFKDGLAEMIDLANTKAELHRLIDEYMASAQ